MERKQHIILLGLVVCFGIFIYSIPLLQSINHQWNHTIALQSFHSFEDKTGKKNIDEISQTDFSKNFLLHQGNTLRNGQSRSVYWIRIDTSTLKHLEHSTYLAITNPTVKSITLYEPTSHGFKASYSGWGNPHAQGKTDFLYPLFSLSTQYYNHPYIYLQCTSPYTQNYNFELIKSSDFITDKIHLVLTLGLLIGCMLLMTFDNFIKFIALKDKIHLFYVVYISSMIIYQCSLLGILRLIVGSKAELIIANTAAIGNIMIFAATLFMREFINSKKHYPKIDRLIMIICFLSLANALLGFLGFRYQCSVLSMPISLLSGFLTALAALLSIHNKFPQYWYFVIGWGSITIANILFNLRVWGILPNNEVTLCVLLMSATLETVSFSMALSKRMQTIQHDKDMAIALKQIAEEKTLYAQSAYLQAQIKPHFLYNTLNVIGALCSIDASKAKKTVLNLSKYLRFSFDSSNLDKYIPLQDELEFIRAYVEIEQIRFKNKINMIYQIKKVPNLNVPPLIIEPLVENAIKHGIRKKNTPGNIRLIINDVDNGYWIQVEDDGVGMTEEKLATVLHSESNTKKGVGLANIQQRLKLLYNTELIIESTPGGGTKASMLIPIEKENKHERSNIR